MLIIIIITDAKILNYVGMDCGRYKKGIKDVQNVYFKLFSYIQSNKEKLAIDILEKQLRYQPRLREMYSEEQFSKCIGDIKYHLSFLAEAININNIKLFENYVLWAKMLFTI